MLSSAPVEPANASSTAAHLTTILIQHPDPQRLPSRI
jgi:hypothetical protein